MKTPTAVIVAAVIIAASVIFVWLAQRPPAMDKGQQALCALEGGTYELVGGSWECN